MKLPLHVVTGLLMGPMLLVALHGGGVAEAALFALAHVAAIAALGLALMLGAGRFDLGRRLLAHRPSSAHIGAMISAMALSAGAAHFLHAAFGHGGAV